MTLADNLPNIALLGRMGSGKSTIAQLLIDLYGFTKMSWAQPVKDIAALAYGPVNKTQGYEVELPDGRIAVRTGREILQRIGTDAMRDNVDTQFWIRAGVRRIENRNDITWVNDDTRFPNEADALVRRGWVIVRVQLPEDIRIARLTGLTGVPPTPEQLNHPSESQIDDIDVHIKLWNTGSPIETTEALLATVAGMHLVS